MQSLLTADREGAVLATESFCFCRRLVLLLPPLQVSPALQHAAPLIMIAAVPQRDARTTVLFDSQIGAQIVHRRQMGRTHGGHQGMRVAQSPQ
jgi:hypothetical protein